MNKPINKRLGDIVNFKRGYDLPSYNRKAGPYPIVSSSGISGYHSEYKADGEGLVTGRYGTLGEMYYIDGKYWPHNTALYVTDFKGNYPKYIYFLLKCLGNLQTADKSTVPGVNRNDLHELLVPYIGPDFQKPIADLLFTIETKIDLNNRINAELEAMAKMLYDYWFVQFDFPFDFPSTSLRAGAHDRPAKNGKPYKSSGGKMVWNKELKREIPLGWEVAELRDCLNCNLRTLASTNNLQIIRYLDTSNLTNNRVDVVQEIDCNCEEVPVRAKRIVSKNDILISTVRPNQNHFGIIKEPVDNMIASTGFAVLSSRIAALSNDFFYMFITTDSNLSKLQRIAESATSSYPSISPEDILNLKIALPKNKEVLKIACDMFNSILTKVSKTHKENQHLSSLRDWLLPMLMNGQVRVN